MDWLFNAQSFAYIGLYYFIIVELASIVENYGEINPNLPKGLTELMKKIRSNFGSLVVKKAETGLKKLYGDEIIGEKEEDNNE